MLFAFVHFLFFVFVSVGDVFLRYLFSVSVAASVMADVSFFVVLYHCFRCCNFLRCLCKFS